MRRLITRKVKVVVSLLIGIALPIPALSVGPVANCDFERGSVDLDKCVELRKTIERLSRLKKCEGGQLDMEYCAADKLHKKESALRAELQAYEYTLANPKDVKKLKDAQALWAKFKDADCAAVVAADDRHGVALLQWYDCLTERTNHRIAEIKNLTQCNENGCRPERN